MSQYSPGWMDPRTIEGPFTLIAPVDFGKINLKGEDHFFDSMEMGWRFYYDMAKRQKTDAQDRATPLPG